MGKRTRRGLTSSFTGVFASTKCLGLPRFESLLERDFHTLLCCDPRVACYAVQSHQLTYFTPNRTGTWTERLYTPDFIVRLTSGQTLIIEVKAEAFTTSSYWCSREPYIRNAYARDYALQFVLITERRIRVQPRLSNFQKMLRYGGRYDDRSAVQAVSDALARLPQAVCIGDICDVVRLRQNRTARAYAAIMSLALRGRVCLDLESPFSLTTAVTRGGEDE
ncbi:MAG: hypothetical protein JO056_06070 [Alphaproteobacteria bacterium]|nr:hypothetical protein [Alphaproteobacteria bacterium]